jgi:hypothetical protein
MHVSAENTSDVRSELSTAVTMNVVFWDIKPSSYRTGDTLRLRYRAKPVNAKYDSDVFTAVTMNNAVFWDVTPCCSCKNRRFGGMYRHSDQGYC